MSTVGAIFSAISKVFGWMTNRSELKNAPDIKAAAKAQSDVAEADKDAKAIADKDSERVRRELAE